MKLFHVSFVCRCCGTPAPGTENPNIEAMLEEPTTEGDMNGHTGTITRTDCSHCRPGEYIGKKRGVFTRAVVATYWGV
jgi:hypothetical protein